MTYDTDGATGNGGAEPEVTDSLKGFGEVVKAFRRRANLTQEEFAHVVGYSLPTVASIEQGRRFPSASFVERAEEVLDAFGAIRGAAKHLSRKPGLARWFRQWAELEKSAITLYTYECRVVPGLLQTEKYSAALHSAHLPPLSDEQIEDQQRARAERQQLLHQRPNTTFAFILEEHLFHRGLGGEEARQELLAHLIELVQQRNITIQIMPLRQGEHAGLQGSLHLLETPENKWLGYVEGQASGLMLTDPKVVSTLKLRYARMTSQALSAKDSLSLMQRMMRGEA
ncbi:helix-turn-helix transcriptional regulator [Streptomyces sp. NPDC048442]|uniref:helix-turn-helix domain-containing protein n=1 Tax=Streptomyces sp. NPDC048442 TaxID=3154823 RepID=UPI00344593DB